nr:N-formylglutamate amidohydrolase [Planosporangium flavigriseum]
MHVPHSSRHITPAARPHILLDDAALTAELDHMTDAHTSRIADRAASGAARTPWTFTNLSSRLVVDPERFPDEREEMLEVGMGAVYTRTSHRGKLRNDDPAHEKDLLATHYEPYAAAMTDLVDDRLAATGRAVIIDVHSYPAMPLPYELHADGERPAVCLGADETHTPPYLLAAAEYAFSSCGSIAVNTPFSGCYVPLKHYGKQRAVTALMVEIRRDTYMTEPGGALTAGIDRIVEALTRLVDVVSAATAGNRPSKAN